MTLTVVNPATEKPIAELAQAGVGETDEAVASAKARNQNCEASAPVKPANSDGFHARNSANSTVGRRSDR